MNTWLWKATWCQWSNYWVMWKFREMCFPPPWTYVCFAKGSTYRDNSVQPVFAYFCKLEAVIVPPWCFFPLYYGNIFIGFKLLSECSLWIYLMIRDFIRSSDSEDSSKLFHSPLPRLVFFLLSHLCNSEMSWPLPTPFCKM